MASWLLNFPWAEVWLRSAALCLYSGQRPGGICLTELRLRRALLQRPKSSRPATMRPDSRTSLASLLRIAILDFDAGSKQNRPIPGGNAVDFPSDNDVFPPGPDGKPESSSCPMFGRFA